MAAIHRDRPQASHADSGIALPQNLPRSGLTHHRNAAAASVYIDGITLSPENRMRKAGDFLKRLLIALWLVPFCMLVVLLLGGGRRIKRRLRGETGCGGCSPCGMKLTESIESINDSEYKQLA